ncbi:MAG: response regulator [Alphaproteobacteria bacterium]|nr:MAG: response regulator [Alphaproteobacteria bacterium]
MTARILVVDDIEVNLRLLEARLHAEYFEVITASSGAEALAICARETIDLVLLDVMMPDMDGYAVCRALRLNSRTQHLPIVMITALDEASDRLKGLEAGADDFLTKPVRDLQLFSRVRSLTRLKLLTDELRARAETTVDLMAGTDILARIANGGSGGRVLVFGESDGTAGRVRKYLRSDHEVAGVADPSTVLKEEATGSYDIFIISLSAVGYDPLRLCSQIRSSDHLRQIPILLLTDPADEARTTIWSGRSIGTSFPPASARRSSGGATTRACGKR